LLLLLLLLLLETTHGDYGDGVMHTDDDNVLPTNRPHLRPLRKTGGPPAE